MVIDIYKFNLLKKECSMTHKFTMFMILKMSTGNCTLTSFKSLKADTYMYQMFNLYL